MVLDTHRPEPALGDLTISTVPVANDTAWCAVPADVDTEFEQFSVDSGVRPTMG